MSPLPDDCMLPHRRASGAVVRHSKSGRSKVVQGHQRRFRACVNHFCYPINFSVLLSRSKRRSGPCMDGARVARANLTFCEAFGCSHVYGLFSRGGLPHRDAAAVAAGPDVIRGSGPNQFHAFLPRVAQKRVFPIDGLDRFASMSSSPLQFLNALTQPHTPLGKLPLTLPQPSRSTGLAADQQRPGDAGHFVGKRNRDNLERSPCQKLRDPWKFLRVALGPAQDSTAPTTRMRHASSGRPVWISARFAFLRSTLSQHQPQSRQQSRGLIGRLRNSSPWAAIPDMHRITPRSQEWFEVACSLWWRDAER